MITLPVYECEAGCGACCRWLIIKIDELDLAREPRLKDLAEPCKKWPGFDYDRDEYGEPVQSLVPGWEAGGNLACGSGKPCKALGDDGRCTIYPTRPNCCVAFRAGCQQCQEARAAVGLPPLQPKGEIHER